MFRRGYSYNNGTDDNGVQDEGLLFLAYVKDVEHQFVRIQNRIAAHDRLNCLSLRSVVRYSSFRQGLIIEGGSGNRYLPKLDRRPRRATKDESAGLAAIEDASRE